MSRVCELPLSVFFFFFLKDRVHRISMYLYAPFSTHLILVPYSLENLHAADELRKSLKWLARFSDVYS